MVVDDDQKVTDVCRDQNLGKTLSFNLLPDSRFLAHLNPFSLLLCKAQVNVAHARADCITTVSGLVDVRPVVGCEQGTGGMSAIVGHRPCGIGSDDTAINQRTNLGGEPAGRTGILLYVGHKRGVGVAGLPVSGR